MGVALFPEGPELLNRFTINNLAKRQLATFTIGSVFTGALRTPIRPYFDLSVSLVTFTVLRQKHPETVRLPYAPPSHAWAATMLNDTGGMGTK